MGNVVQPSSGEVPIVPDGLYLATITGVKPITLDTPDQFGKSEKLEISLEFDVGGEIVNLDPRVNRAWSEKATLFLIAVASGLDVNPSEAFDADDLIDREVNILTEQEEGKWPRVKAWSKVGKKAAAARASGRAASSATPAVINQDGSPNHTAFWSAISALGLNRKHVIDKVGGDIEAFTKMDGPELAFLLEELTLQVQTA